MAPAQCIRQLGCTANTAGWLASADVARLTALEAGSPEARGRQGWIFLGAPWEDVFPASLLGVQMAVLSL